MSRHHHAKSKVSPVFPMLVFFSVVMEVIALRGMVFRFLACVGAVPLCVYLLPGVTASDYTYAIYAGVVLGVIYITLRPIAKLLLGVFNLFTLGLLYVLLDAWLVQLCSWVMLDKFHVDNFLWALATALIVNVARGFLGKHSRSQNKQTIIKRPVWKTSA